MAWGLPGSSMSHCFTPFRLWSLSRTTNGLPSVLLVGIFFLSFACVWKLGVFRLGRCGCGTRSWGACDCLNLSISRCAGFLFSFSMCLRMTGRKHPLEGTHLLRPPRAGTKYLFNWVCLQRTSTRAHTWQAVNILWKVHVCCVLFALAQLFKATIAKLLSTHFYKTAHFRKLESALEKEYFLQVRLVN